MCVGNSGTVVLGTGSSYGMGIIEPFWGGMGRADCEKNVELLKVLNKGNALHLICKF